MTILSGLVKALGVSIKRGSTRTVVVFGKKVYKFPLCRNFDTFFKGLAANHKERINSKYCPNFFVPVLFSIPGLLVVMPKVRTLPESCPLVRSFMFDLFHHSRDEDPEAQHARFYCEYITDNYGMYKGKPMCIDYGTYMPLEATRFDLKRELDLQEWDIKRRVMSSEPEETVLHLEESYQICLELLDIPIFAPNVESKGRSVAHELDGKQQNLEGQISGTPGSSSDTGSYRLGMFPFISVDVQAEGRLLSTQKKEFAPTIPTVYTGNAAL